MDFIRRSYLGQHSCNGVISAYLIAFVIRYLTRIVRYLIGPDSPYLIVIVLPNLTQFLISILTHSTYHSNTRNTDRLIREGIKEKPTQMDNSRVKNLCWG